MNELVLNKEQLRAEIAVYRKIPAFKQITPSQRKFLIAYAGCGVVHHALKICGMATGIHHYWFQTSEKYKEAFENARQMFADRAEGDIWQRAFVGTEVKTRRYGKDGSFVETVENKKSDVLAMFSMKALRPVYRDNFAVNQFSGPTQFNITFSNQSAVTAPESPANSAKDITPPTGLLPVGEEKKED